MTSGALPYVDPGRHPGASSAAIARRMSTVRRRDNAPEMAVRRALRARGVGYRVCLRVPGQRRRSIDIAFLRARLAVYVDGCFWHGCPDHSHLPKANREWWMAKLAANRARDAAVNAQLAEMGWTVLRFWEHEAPDDVADLVVGELTHLRDGRSSSRGGEPAIASGGGLVSATGYRSSQ